MAAVQYPPRKLWTRAECERLESLGAFDQMHLELIEGELIDKTMSKNRPHVKAAAMFIGWLIQVFGARFVNTEAPIDVAPQDNPTSQPVPDALVLTGEYVATNQLATPQPRDLALVVEISDTSLAFDLTVKARLYARARIAEYWVIDLTGRRLIVHRDPEDGNYRSIASYSESDAIAPLAAPDSAFPSRQIFSE
jgi:Uma2 family endonuclease